MLQAKSYNLKAKRGFSIIEVVAGLAVIAIVLAGIFAAFYTMLGRALRATAIIKAQFIAEEGLEAARALRDQGWSVFTSIPVNSTRHLAFSGGKWESTTTPQTIDGLHKRTVTFEEVFRKTVGDDIVASTSPDSKYSDSDARKAQVRVVWGDAANEILLETYLTNLFEN